MMCRSSPTREQQKVKSVIASEDVGIKFTQITKNIFFLFEGKDCSALFSLQQILRKRIMDSSFYEAHLFACIVFVLYLYILGDMFVGLVTETPEARNV